MPNMPRILGDDTAATPDSHFGIVIRRPRPFPHYPTDRRRAQDETDPGEHLRHPLVSHRWEQALQLPHEIPDKVGVAVDGLYGLNERKVVLSLLSARGRDCPDRVSVYGLLPRRSS